MKKITIYVTFLFIGISIISCKKNVDGKWDDNIKLSAKDIHFDSFQHSKTITTKSTNWWLNGISLNGNIVDLTNINKLSKNFIVTHSEFKVERQEDGKKIIISMSQNNTSSDRTLIISLQNGDYFDGIKVTQTK